MLKKLLITISPLILFVALESVDGWTTWKDMNLYFRKKETKAKIIENPFYEKINSGEFIDKYTEVIDHSSLFEYSYTNNYPKIVIEYKDEYNKVYTDSISYNYYFGDNIEFNYLSSFIEESLLDKNKGDTFNIYYYKDRYMPKEVFYYLDKNHSSFKHLFLSSGFWLFCLAILFTLGFWEGQFKNRFQKH